jgi:hypothetical protein
LESAEIVPSCDFHPCLSRSDDKTRFLACLGHSSELAQPCILPLRRSIRALCSHRSPVRSCEACAVILQASCISGQLHQLGFPGNTDPRILRAALREHLPVARVHRQSTGPGPLTDTDAAGQVRTAVRQTWSPAQPARARASCRCDGRSGRRGADGGGRGRGRGDGEVVAVLEGRQAPLRHACTYEWRVGAWGCGTAALTST